MDAADGGQARRARAPSCPALRERRVKRGRRRPRAEDAEPERRCPARSDVAADNPVPDAAVLGRPGRQGHRRWPTTPRYLDERATFLGQWGLQAASRGDGPSLRGAGRDRGPAAAARLAGPDPDRGHARGRGGLRLLPVLSARATTWSCSTDGERRRRRELHRFTFPRQRRDRHLCLADFFRPRGRRGEARRGRRSSWSPWAAGQRGRPASCSRRTPTATTSSCTGCRVQLTEALAEYWHARVRAELGLRRARTPDDRRGSSRPGLPRARGTPSATGLPRPGGPGQDGASCCEPERIGVELSEELQLHPEQSTDALVVHHPEAKYFNV